jgi:hypothetical protein
MQTWILARLTERSTWYGLGVVVAGAASHFAPAEWTAFLAGVQFVLAGGAVITPENKA